MVVLRRTCSFILLGSLALSPAITAQQAVPPSGVHFYAPALVDRDTGEKAAAGNTSTISFCDPAPKNVNDLCGAKSSNPFGGQGPYHFVLDTMGGFPPIGMTLHPNGLLTGTPKTPGAYRFRVCAVDMAGNQDCQNVEMEVQQAPGKSKGKRTSNDAAGETAAAAKPAKSGGPSKALMLGIIGGGGALGAAAAAKAVQKASGCDTSKAPKDEIYTYCFGSSRNTTQCNYYIGEYDKLCKSCGYSGFNAETGNCK